MTDPPRPPVGLKRGGRALWTSVAERFELEEHEALVLAQACRCADALDLLEALVRRQGPMRRGSVNPALVEARQQSLTLVRLLASLRLPDEQDVRPQRRGSARGVYQQHKTARLALIREQQEARS